MRAWWAAPAVSIAIACGCASELPPPTYVTAVGISVWIHGRTYAPEQIDAAFLGTLAEFADRYDSEPALRSVRRARVSILDADEYELNGGKVAGSVSFDSSFIFVGGKTRELPQTALVHEIVHYLDLQLTGDTDSSHASWNPRVYEGIARVNASLAESQQKLSPRQNVVAPDD